LIRVAWLALSGKIGVELEELSTDGIAAALNKRISGEVGALLGLEGLDLFNGGDIREQARALAIQAIASGRPSKLVGPMLMKRLRTAAAYVAAGVDLETQVVASNRGRQRAYRMENKQIWQ
jgi:hypothetical protein